MVKRYIGVLLAVATLIMGGVLLTRNEQAPYAGSEGKIGSGASPSGDLKMLPPDEAFRLQATVSGNNTILVELTPADGYHLYRDKIRFTLKNSTGVAIDAVKLPRGEIKKDEIFGEIELYMRSTTAEIVLKREPTVKNIALRAAYQGCEGKLGVCYPPMEKELDVVFP